MSASEPREVLIVEGVSKRFRMRRARPATLQASLIEWLTGRRQKRPTLWALRDVSFTVRQGRVLGVIGHNGAGKSTLLRLLCDLSQPTSGRIHRRGQVSALLELGSGIHPDLTGRENIITVGILNGLTRRQILREQDEVIAFAELEEFIDQPVRTYSSGMYLRLAFAVATHFQPDVLLLDEVLTVGDARFQQKCLDRLSAFRAAGKTLVITSHDMGQIQSLCNEVLVLESGRVAMLGDPSTAVERYTELMRERTARRARQLAGGVASLSVVVEQGDRQGTAEAVVDAVTVYDAHGQPTESVQSGDGLTIELEYSLAKPLPDMALSLAIYSDAKVKCLEIAVPSARALFGPLATPGTIRCHLPELPLLPGCYYVTVGLYPPDWDYVYDYHWQMHALRVSGPASDVTGIVSVRPSWSVPVEDDARDTTRAVADRHDPGAGRRHTAVRPKR